MSRRLVPRKSSLNNRDNGIDKKILSKLIEYKEVTQDFLDAIDELDALRKAEKLERLSHTGNLEHAHISKPHNIPLVKFCGKIKVYSRDPDNKGYIQIFPKSLFIKRFPDLAVVENTNIVHEYKPLTFDDWLSGREVISYDVQVEDVNDEYCIYKKFDQLAISKIENKQKELYFEAGVKIYNLLRVSFDKKMEKSVDKDILHSHYKDELSTLFKKGEKQVGHSTLLKGLNKGTGSFVDPSKGFDITIHLPKLSFTENQVKSFRSFYRDVKVGGGNYYPSFRSLPVESRINNILDYIHLFQGVLWSFKEYVDTYDWLSRKEYALLYGISVSTVDRLRNKNKLTFKKVGRKILIKNQQ